MCGGGGNDNSEAMAQAEERHDENMALQREQLEEQKKIRQATTYC